ncbi:DUF6479 family protein [Streptomyces sp. NPDC057638]|uniref:DUF6479 family protein n=1 Tax=Streptomyces sp. NPDC057638 TaxID=3346190 RepID=UPI0036AB6279
MPPGPQGGGVGVGAGGVHAPTVRNGPRRGTGPSPRTARHTGPARRPGPPATRDRPVAPDRPPPVRPPAPARTRPHPRSRGDRPLSRAPGLQTPGRVHSRALKAEIGRTRHTGCRGTPSGTGGQGDTEVGLMPLMILFGAVLVALLCGAMWYDGRRRAALRVPTPEEQPKAPDHRAHIEEVREEDTDTFPTDGDRLLPYNMHTHSTHSTGKGREARPLHGKNVGGGAFGSGGLGG